MQTSIFKNLSSLSMNYLSIIFALNSLFIHAIIYPMQSGISKTARTVYALQKRNLVDFTHVNFDVIADELKKNKQKTAPIITSTTTTSPLIQNVSREFYQTATEFGEYINGKRIKLQNIYRNSLGLIVTMPINTMNHNQINFEIRCSFLHLKNHYHDSISIDDYYERNQLYDSLKNNHQAKKILYNFFHCKKNTLTSKSESIILDDKIEELVKQQIYMNELLQRQYELEQTEEEKELNLFKQNETFNSYIDFDLINNIKI